jgi:hypothetical protein
MNISAEGSRDACREYAHVLIRSMRRRKNCMDDRERATLKPSLRRSRAAADAASRLPPQSAGLMPNRAVIYVQKPIRSRTSFIVA